MSLKFLCGEMAVLEEKSNAPGAEIDSSEILSNEREIYCPGQMALRRSDIFHFHLTPFFRTFR
jgi:hypothetical protein